VRAARSTDSPQSSHDCEVTRLCAVALLILVPLCQSPASDCDTARTVRRNAGALRATRMSSRKSLPTVVEVEVPGTIAVGIPALSNRDMVAAHARKSDAQSDAGTVIYEEIIPEDRRHHTNFEPGTPQPVRDATFWEQMFLNSIHVRFDVEGANDIRKRRRQESAF